MPSTTEIIEVKSALKNYAAFIRSRKNIIIYFLITGALLGLSFAFIKKTKYHAHLSFMINEKDNNTSALMGLAGQFALLNGVGGVGANDDKVVFLLPTRSILGNALLKKMPQNKLCMADAFLSYFKWNNLADDDTTFIGFNGFQHSSISNLSYAENKALDKIIEKLLKSGMLSFESVKRKSLVAQASGILCLDVTTKDEVLSKALCDAWFETIQHFYIKQSLGRLEENYSVLCFRADSLKNRIQEKEIQYGSTADYNTGLIKISGRVNEMHLKKEVEMLNLMYAEVVKNREITRISLDQQKPFFQIIDQPSLPLEEIKQSKIVSISIGLMIGFLMGFLFLSIRFLYK